MSDGERFTCEQEKLLDSWTERTVQWIREHVQAAGCEGTVLGLSGGLDSAVAAALCARATPGQVLGVILPCQSPAEDVEDAELTADALAVQRIEIPLDGPFASLVSLLPQDGTSGTMALANVKPRLRMIILYYMASLRNSLVVGTGNRDEIHLGYFTKHGDGGADLFPLAHLVKAQVVRVAEYLGVPQKIIERPPSAGLWPGQTDEEELGLRYDDIDRYLLEGTAEPGVAERIQSMHRRTAHKRSTPPTPPFRLADDVV